MNSNTVPTPIVDKNGKLTTVHKAIGRQDGSKSSLSSIAPPPPSPSGTPIPSLALPSLSAEEIDAFLLSHAIGKGDMFRSLSGNTQALVRQSLREGAIDDAELDILLRAMRDDLNFGWRNTVGVSKLTEDIMRSTLLTAEALHSRYSLGATLERGWSYSVRQSVIGCGYRGKGAVSSAPVFSTQEELAPVAAVTAFVLAVKEHAQENSNGKRIVIRNYNDTEGRTHIGTGITSPVLEAYILEHPEAAYEVGKFATQRDLGSSAEEIATVISHFQTSEARAVREGWL